MPEQFTSSTKKMRSTTYRLIFLVSLLLILVFISKDLLKHLASKAPDENFVTIKGKNIALKDLRGKSVIVTFWATDCPACVKEIPDFIDLYKQYHKQGLEIIAVAMYYDPPNHVVTLTEEQQLPYDVTLDLKAEHVHAFGNVQFIPSTFLIAPDGSFALKKTGAIDSDEMKALIEKLLKG